MGVVKNYSHHHPHCVLMTQTKPGKQKESSLETKKILPPPLEDFDPPRALLVFPVHLI